jgi:hypothetical protein
MNLQIVHGDNFSLVYIIGDFIMQEDKTWKPRNEHLQNLSYHFIQGSYVENVFGKKLLLGFCDIHITKKKLLLRFCDV